MEKLSQEFTAVDESGIEHRLLVYQEWVSGASRANLSAVRPGKKRIQTEQGESVSRMKKGEYQVVATRAILRSADPDAP